LHVRISRFQAASRPHLAQYQWNQEYRGSEHLERLKMKDHRRSDASAEDEGDPDFTEKAPLRQGVTWRFITSRERKPEDHDGIETRPKCDL